MNKHSGTTLAAAAFALYILGGVGAFAGIALILAMNGRDLWHLGDGRSLGYLFLCVGLCLSIAGVLLMRILRNRLS